MNYDDPTALIPTWAKDPSLEGSDWLVIGSCIKRMDPDKFAELSKGKVVLSVCPEAENVGVVYGKLASMIRSGRPRSITTVSVECSPHCYTLQAAVNEAIYIANAHDIPLSLNVFHQGEVKPISAEAVRVSRYLHLVEELIQDNPEILEKLESYSLEHKAHVEAKSRG